MKYQVDESDLGSYLGMMGAKLVKEGHSLQALAAMWYGGEEDDNVNIVKSFGGDLIDMGEQLSALRSRLCQNCILQEVKIFLHVGPDDSPAEGNDAGRDQ
jgi:hypothetical protein